MIFSDLGYTAVILTNGEVENYWEISNLIKKQLAGFTQTIENFFYTKNIIKTICDQGYNTAEKAIQGNKAENTLRESLIERYGYKMLFERKNQQAIDLFKTNIKHFPDSYYCYYNLSEAYRVMGRKDEALHYLQLYLEKEPGATDAKLKYEKLKQSD